MTLMTCTHFQYFSVIKSRRMRIEELGHVWGRGKTYTRFCCGNFWERDHLENPGVDRFVILISNFTKLDMEA